MVTSSTINNHQQVNIMQSASGRWTLDRQLSKFLIIREEGTKSDKKLQNNAKWGGSGAFWRISKYSSNFVKVLYF